MLSLTSSSSVLSVFVRLSSIALLCCCCCVAQFPGPGGGVKLTEVTSGWENPGGLRFFYYKPSSAPASGAPILVAPHFCRADTSWAQSWYSFDAKADKYGFIVLYPQNTHTNNCFDISSPATLKHNGGGDSLSIVNMVEYALKTFNADATRVFVSGFSSGGSITNVLCAVYPDVFVAGSVWSSPPAGCHDPSATSAPNNSTCDAGKVSKSGAEWGKLARSFFPEYTGTYPRMQLFHGDKDEMVNYANYIEDVKYWCNLHGLSETQPDVKTQNAPNNGWTRSRYGGSDDHAKLEATSVSGGTHALTFNSDLVMKFFGLDGSWKPTPANVTTDPCKTSNGGCDATNGQCASKDGVVTCSCKSGYQLGADQKSCSLIAAANACKTSNGGCDAVNGLCSMGVSGVTCSCKAGFQLASDRKACTALPNASTGSTVVNLCQTSNGGCDAEHATCSVTGATVRCKCVSGYQLNADSKTCTVKPTNASDPCSTDPCGDHGSCTKLTATTYKCKCTDQYTGDRCEIAPPPVNNNPCASDTNPCGDGGDCIEASGKDVGYLCSCKDGFEANAAESFCERKMITEPNESGSSLSISRPLLVIIVVAGLVLFALLGCFICNRKSQTVERMTQWMRRSKASPDAPTNTTAGAQQPYANANPNYSAYPQAPQNTNAYPARY